MKVKGLDGKTYILSTSNSIPLNSEERLRSEFHLRTRNLLHTLFPLDRILEEVPLPGSDGLTVDFFVPAYKLFIEVHGRQHYEFVQHFHQDILGFYRSRRRDARKREWAELNDLHYVELPYTETDDEWRERILCGEKTSTS
jgi:hypothetical protein